jgi:2-polyprenyl-3-methyl-5-hydroxy-6-metoxy-1,4-benzoquinol methylase
MELLNSCPLCGLQKTELLLSAQDYFLTSEPFDIVQCVECGFRFTNPRPCESDLSKYYQSAEYISHSDTRKGILASVYQLVRQYTLKRKRKLIEKYHKGGEILDIGCATGHFLNKMARHGWITTGIEPDDTTRGYAIAEYGLNVFSEDKLDEFTASSFDVITMWHVLEHVAQLNKRIQQLRKLIKPGGTIIIAVPNCESYDAIKYGRFWAGYDLPRHLYHFTKSDISKLAEKIGMRIESVLPMKFDSYYVSLLSEKYKYGKLRWGPALWNGFWSNLIAGGKYSYSSQIYVLKMK